MSDQVVANTVQGEMGRIPSRSEVMCLALNRDAYLAGWKSVRERKKANHR